MEERVIFLIRILVRILSLDWFDWNNYKISSDRLQKKKKKNMAELGNGFLISEDYDRLLSSIFAFKW